MDKLNVYLLFGAESPEHEVSMVSAKQAFKSFDRDKYEVFPIYIDKNNKFKYISNFEVFQKFRDFKKLNIKEVSIVIKNNNIRFKLNQLQTLPAPDVFFPCMHGGIGENGAIQGLLDIIDIPYTGPRMKSAVYGMDKIVMKYIFEKNDLKVLPWMHFTKNEWLKDKNNLLDRIEAFNPYPLIVKPSSLGSSIGVKKVENREELTDIIDQDILFDSNIIVEKFGSGMAEINCSVLRNKEMLETTATEEIPKGGKFYTYEEKYVRSGKGKKAKTGNNEGFAGGTRIMPADVSDKVNDEIIEMAKKAYEVTDGEGVARIDFLVNKETEEIYIIEINTIPGSLSFYMWEQKGVQFFELLDILIENAIYKHKQEKKFIKIFDSPLWEN